MQSPATNSILTHLSKEEPDARVEMARHVKAMTDHPGWAVFTGILEKRIADQRVLVECHDRLPEYAEMVSRTSTLRGLLFAMSIPEAVLIAGDRADNELRQIVANREANTA